MTLRITAKQQRVASLQGFREALDRHDAAEGLRSSFVSLSEALWWTTAIEDELVRSVRGYYAERDGDERAAALPGLRYVRNFATHQAVALTEVGPGGLTIPFTAPFRIPGPSFYWLPFDDLPRPAKTSKHTPAQQESYRVHLAERRTTVTLDRAGAWLESVMARLVFADEDPAPIPDELRGWWEQYQRENPHP